MNCFCEKGQKLVALGCGKICVKCGRIPCDPDQNEVFRVVRAAIAFAYETAAQIVEGSNGFDDDHWRVSDIQEIIENAISFLEDQEFAKIKEECKKTIHMIFANRQSS